MFYILYFLVTSSALLVISSENAVYSVLFLIVTFCNIIFLLLLMGAEFLSFLLLIVYVGAIAVLFLFVVMMLNIKKSNKNFKNFITFYFPLTFLMILFLIDYFWSFCLIFDVLKNINMELNFINWFNELVFTSNLEAIGDVFYTNYCFLFIISGCILLIAMIGVIVLTIHQKTFSLLKKQSINFQLVRKSKKIVKFINLRKIN